MKPSTNSCDTHTKIWIPDQIDEPINQPNIPLLMQKSYARCKSLIHDELRKFGICLKWCALDHSTTIGKLVSYTVFTVFAVVVPVLNSVVVRVPKTAPAEDPTSFNKLVYLPESGLAAIAFFTLSGFFKRYGLRQLLFLDCLNEDAVFVQRGYTRELDKAFRNLACIVLPSLFVELAHKFIFYCTVDISLPYVGDAIPLNSVAFFVDLASWVYRTGVFLLVCVLFRLTCELQILRFEGFQKLLEGYGSDAAVIFEEHVRIRRQLSVTSHRYRFFIIGCLVTITVSQFGALLLVFASKAEKSFFNSGDLVVCSAVQLSGFFLCLMGAARITHRAQRIVSVATQWHMLVTCASSDNVPTHKHTGGAKTTEELPVSNDSSGPSGGESDSSETSITVCPQEPSSFRTRQALVTYLQHNNGGITLFGFALDRGLLQTLFVFEFSLVLWILSKVVVL